MSPLFDCSLLNIKHFGILIIIYLQAPAKNSETSDAHLVIQNLATPAVKERQGCEVIEIAKALFKYSN
jgi:hypothetical protein